MTKIIFVILMFFYLAGAEAQLLPNGQYIGYEAIHVRKATDSTLVFYPGMYIKNVENSIDKSLFHQVTLTIYNDSATILRTPIFVKDNHILYSDSIGGFYHYKGNVVRLTDATIVIRTNLDATKFEAYHGTATPYYAFCYYSHVKVEADNLTLQAGYLGRLTFRKIQ